MIDGVALAQKLIQCESVTPADAGAIDVVIAALEPLGFACTKLKFGDIENLFARRGTTGPHLSFAGHTDVVPPGDLTRWTYPPFAAEIHDGVMYGRGAADMKGNIAAFIAAIPPEQTSGSISLIITGDEEGPAINGTVKILEWMAENGHTPDVAVVGEPTNPAALGDEIKIGRRGSLSGTLTITGIQGHVAYPDRAYNPIPKLAQMIDALSSNVLDEGSDHFGPSTLQVTNIHVGNTADNVIPGQASAKFNIRFNDLWSAEKLETELRDLLDLVGPDYDLKLHCGAESFLTQPGDFTDLVRDAVQAVTGRTPKFSTSGGTSDARFVTRYCPVVECGLINETIHKFDECVAVEDIQHLQKIYAEILKRYFKS
jgi:succinyl-diaminopimelate desuccinylase